MAIVPRLWWMGIWTGWVGCACPSSATTPESASIPKSVSPPDPPPGLDLVVLPGICEPSGGARDRAGDVWIVDDDQEDVVFRWSPPQPPVPVPLPKDQWAKDPEGIARAADGAMWVVGSHSQNRKGMIGDRARFLRWTSENPLDARVLPVQLLGAPPEQPARWMRRVGAACDGCGVPVESVDHLNIEGISLRPGTTEMLVGLRAPLTVDRRALVVAQAAPDLTAPMSVPAPTMVWALNLGGRGVRDLTLAPDGSGVWILAGPPEDSDPDGLGFAVFSWTEGGPIQERLRLPPMPGSPEGLVPTGESSAWVLLDEGDRLGDAELPVHTHKGKFRCGKHPELAGPNDWAHAVAVKWTNGGDIGAARE